MAKRIKTGGRKQGTPNKATAAKAAAIEASGLTPLDFMLKVMRDGRKKLAVRLDAARSAAPYVHPRLTAIEHTGKDGKDLIPEFAADSIENARAIAFMLTCADRGIDPKKLSAPVKQDLH